MPSALEWAQAKRAEGVPLEKVHAVLRQAGVFDESNQPIPGMAERDIDQLLTARGRKQRSVGEETEAFVKAAQETGNASEVMAPDVAQAFAFRDEQRRRLAGASKEAPGLAAKALYAPSGGVGLPAAALTGLFGPGRAVRGAIEQGAERGFLPPELTPASAAEHWQMVGRGERGTTSTMAAGEAEKAAEILGEPTTGEKVRSFFGSIPKTVGLLGAGLRRSPAGAIEEVMGGERAVPPGGRSVRLPTVVSTTFDVVGTLQRTLVTAPVEAIVGDRTGEQWWQMMGNGFKLPSWSNGEPRDNATFVRRTLKELGYNPNSIPSVLTQVAASLADPIMAVGGPRDARTVVAIEQAVRDAKAGLAALGMRGQVLDQQTAAVAKSIAETVRQAGDLGAARMPVKSLIADMVNDFAAERFYKRGATWGEQGLLLGIPGLRGREKYGLLGANPEVVSAQTLAGQRGPIRGGVAGAIVGGAGWGLEGAIAGAAAGAGVGKGAQLALRQTAAGAKVGEILMAGRRAWDPSAPPLGTEDRVAWDDYYRQRVIATAEAEHLQAVGGADVGGLAKEYSTLPRRKQGTAANPVRLSTAAAAEWRSDPLRAATAERQDAMAVLSWPMRRATERWGPSKAGELIGVEGDGTLLPDPALTGGKPLDFDSPESHVIRQAYSSAQVAVEKGASVNDAAAGFADYVVAGLKGEGWADDAATGIAVDLLGRVPAKLAVDGPEYTGVWRGMEARLENLVRSHERIEKGNRAVLAAKITPHAKRMAAKAAAKARAEARATGAGHKDVAKAGAEAATKAHAEIMAKLGGTIDNHFTHIIRNREAIQRRIPYEHQPGGPNFMKHRQFVDVIENVEHGQDPATDLLLSTHANIKATADALAEWSVADFIVKDRRWAVPMGESEGLRVQAGWQPWAHPITGEKYRVRQEVLKDLGRVVDGYKPGGIDAVFEAIATAAPWLGKPMSGWKARATHGNFFRYNMRNLLPDDAWRMWMGGYDGSVETAKEAFKIGLLGHLDETAIAHAAAKAGRRNPKALENRLEDGFRGIVGRLATDGVVTQKGTGAKATYKEVYAEAAKRGVVDKGHVAAELSSPEAIAGTRGKRWSPAELGLKDLNPLHRDHVVVGEGGFYLKTTGRGSRALENQRRLTSFVSAWKRGETYDEAAHTVGRWNFNYSERADWLRKWVGPFQPFVTFTSKAIPAHWTALKQNPSRYMAFVNAGRAIEEHAESKLPPVGVVPQYVEDASGIRLPYQVPEVRGAPRADAFYSTGLSISEFNILNPAMPVDPLGRSGFFDDVTPVVDMALIMTIGRDPRTGRMLTNEWMEPDASLKLAADLWNATAGRTNALKIPMLPQRRQDGTLYYQLPAASVMLWNKMLPNVIAATSTFFGKSGAFAEQRRPYDVARFFTGQSIYVVNPVKAEADAMKKMNEAIAPSVEGIESRR